MYHDTCDQFVYETEYAIPLRKLFNFLLHHVPIVPRTYSMCFISMNYCIYNGELHRFSFTDIVNVIRTGSFKAP